MPRIGEIIVSPRGQGRVIARNVLKENITVVFEDGVNATLPVTEITSHRPGPRSNGHDDDQDEEEA